MHKVVVFCDSTSFGDTVCLSGEFNSWSTSAPVQCVTTPEKFPFWTAEIPAAPFTQYKYMIRRSNGDIEWEAIRGNRYLVVLNCTCIFDVMGLTRREVLRRKDFRKKLLEMGGLKLQSSEDNSKQSCLCGWCCPPESPRRSSLTPPKLQPLLMVNSKMQQRTLDVLLLPSPANRGFRHAFPPRHLYVGELPRSQY
mmetsp:Transcript_21767/g.54744  ORF Transcript_21767/g.54744 Transcript_21767/m.54744 type:complete len:195 (+) Transcript_21767:279-863(+)